jgi:methyl-accepting chemotaxis protein
LKKKNVSSFIGHLSLTMKLTVAFVSAAVLVSLAISMVLFEIGKAQLMTDIEDRLRSMVGIAALQIDGNGIQSIAVPADQGNPTYNRILDGMHHIRTSGINIANIYTMRKNSKDQIEFVVDGSPKDQANVGDIYEDPSATLADHFSSMTGPVIESDFYTDVYGTWLSGYAPFYTSDGKVAGVLGIDISASEVMHQVNRLLVTALLTGLVVSILVGIVAFGMIRSIIQPIQFITRVALQLSSGNSELSEAHSQELLRLNSRTDELGEISRAFHTMVTYFNDLTQSALSIAAGNLNALVQPKSNQDQLGLAFARMASDLGTILSEIAAHTQQLSQASEKLSSAASKADQAAADIAAAMQSVTEGISVQTDTIVKMAASTDQMAQSIQGVASGVQEQSGAISSAASSTAKISSTIHDVTRMAEAADANAGQAAGTAQAGVATITKSITGMDSIKARVTQSSQKVLEMGQRSDQISEIAETIDDIASQTNLLALNAAIEAARAGEHGKGFAVVADEVRKLAEKSALATRQISDLTKTIQQTVAEAVDAMDRSIAEVESEVANISQSDAALANIQKTVVSVNQQVKGIVSSAQWIGKSIDSLSGSMDTISKVVEENSASTEKMTSESNNISRSVRNIAEVSEQNYASIEAVSGSSQAIQLEVDAVSRDAQSLVEMSRTLQQMVDRFQLDEHEGNPIA